MKAEIKTSKKQKNSKNESKKIILNKKEDLNKISFTDLKNAKIFDFSGDYFDFIYDRALNIEKNPEEKGSLMLFNKQEKDKEETTDKNEAKNKNTNSKKKKRTNKEKEDENDNNSKNIINNNINNNVFFNQENYNIYNNNNIYENKPKKITIKKEFKINKITFQMKYNTQPGEDLGVIGSISELGSWDQNKALRMNWNDGNIWKSSINYDFGREKEFEFKFIFIENGRVKKWEDGNNRKLEFYQLKEIIEPKIKEENNVEFKNSNGKDVIYYNKEGILTIVCNWNQK